MAALSRRWRYAGTHLLISLAIGLVVWFGLLAVWYPHPLDEMLGGQFLFALLLGVDVIVGPLLTAVVSSGAKPLKELGRDLAVIGVLQLAALSYGIWTIEAARPLYLSYEIDRLRIVSKVDVDPDQLAKAGAPFQPSLFEGPRLIAAVVPSGERERYESMQLGMAGVDLSMIPANWRPWPEHKAQAWKVAKPLPEFLKRHAAHASAAAAMAADAGVRVDELRYLPAQSRRAIWTAVLAGPDPRIVGWLPVDGFE